MGKIKSAHMEVCPCVLARVCTAIGLIGVVVAVVVSIADVGRVGADAGATLELPGSTLEVRCSGKTKVWTRERAGRRCFFRTPAGTHGSPLVHRIGRRSRPQCHTSTKRECTCHSYTRTGTQKNTRENQHLVRNGWRKQRSPAHLTCGAVRQALFAVGC